MGQIGLGDVAFPDEPEILFAAQIADPGWVSITEVYGISAGRNERGAMLRKRSARCSGIRGPDRAGMVRECGRPAVPPSVGNAGGVDER